jgi:hypothetical protein
VSRRFKIVTIENWLDPDPVSGSIARVDHRDGTSRLADRRDWIAYASALPLSEPFPQEVCDAYDVTIGALGYSYFYYPLFTLVVQQVLRVADFAVAHLFRIRPDLSKPRRETFEARLDTLRKLAFLTMSPFSVGTAFDVFVIS